MSYRLTYAWSGNELSIPGLPTIDDVNYQICRLYDEVDGYVTILRIEEDHDGPRTWAIEYPPAPPAGTRVKAEGRRIYTLGERGSIDLGNTVYSWKGALETLGPLTEVVETEVEAAARRLREWVDSAGHPYGAVPTDLVLVLDHVLNGGQL